MAIAAPTTGRIVQITGPVIDIEFPAGRLPAIYNAIEVTRGDGMTIVCEVQQHLGNNWVRSVAMTTTDGLSRGVEARDTGGPITVPVGAPTLGRVFNVLGQPIDEKGPVDAAERLPIHRPAPAFDQQTTETEIFETGLKVIDLICPFARGGKIGVADVCALDGATICTGSIDATQNYWGCPAGPGGPGCSTVSGSDIRFSPWLKTPINSNSN